MFYFIAFKTLQNNVNSTCKPIIQQTNKSGKYLKYSADQAAAVERATA